MAEEQKDHNEHNEIIQKDGLFFNREGTDGYFYAGPLFIGLAFTGIDLFCPTCGEQMERNANMTEWFRCNTCKYSYNVLDKIPPDHPFIKQSEEAEEKE